MSRPRFLLIVFLAALSLRFVYGLAHYIGLGADGLMSTDSFTFIKIAENHLAALAGAPGQGPWAWLGGDTAVLPLFIWMLSGALWLGGGDPLAFVLIQGVLDAGTCVFTALLAEAVHRRLFIPAGVFAVANPTLIALGGLVLSDSLFIFWSTLSLLAAVKLWRGPGWGRLDRGSAAWGWAVVLGVAFGAAMLTRVTMLPWIAATLIALAVAFLVRRRPTGLPPLLAATLLAALIFSPVIARNLDRYGSWATTSQTGAYVLLWLVPLTREVADGTPWEKSSAEMRTKLAAAHPDLARRTPFQRSRLMTELAVEELRVLGAGTILRAWLRGAAINLGSPAATISPALARLPKGSFYGTSGAGGFLAKLKRFLFDNPSPTYAWVVILGLLGVAVLRLVQLIGLAGMFVAWRGRRCMVLYLAAWAVFILLISGPVASPKYRAPIEPVLIVFLAAGWMMLADRVRIRRRRRRRAVRASAPGVREA